MLLNGSELLHGRERQAFYVPYYEGRPKLMFVRAGWGIAVVDLRAPPS
jgi:hypothetical protein